MISSSFGSSQYSWGVSFEYFPDWENLSGKSFQLHVITSLICFVFLFCYFFFFKQRFPFSHVLRLFQDNFAFGEATFSHFFRVTISTQQLHFRSTYFFRAAAVFSFFKTATFSSSYFFRIAFFSERKLYRAATS